MKVALERKPDQRLKKVLAERGLRQCELAFALGINNSYLNLVVNGWQTPSEHLQQRIATCLQVDPKEIFEVRQ